MIFMHLLLFMELRQVVGKRMWGAEDLLAPGAGVLEAKVTLGVVLDVLPGLRGLGALQTLPELAVVLYNGVNLVIYHAYKIDNIFW